MQQSQENTLKKSFPKFEISEATRYYLMHEYEDVSTIFGDAVPNTTCDDKNRNSESKEKLLAFKRLQQKMQSRLKPGCKKLGVPNTTCDDKNRNSESKEKLLAFKRLQQKMQSRFKPGCKKLEEKKRRKAHESASTRFKKLKEKIMKRGKNQLYLKDRCNEDTKKGYACYGSEDEAWIKQALNGPWKPYKSMDNVDPIVNVHAMRPTTDMCPIVNQMNNLTINVVQNTVVDLDVPNLVGKPDVPMDF